MVTISYVTEKENLRTLQDNISSPNFGILLLLKGFFREFCFFVWICLDKKLVIMQIVH